MIVAADSSVLIASLVVRDPHHQASVAVLDDYRPFVHRHALVETFSTLTGGRLGFRMPPDAIARLIRESILPWVRTTELNDVELIEAMSVSRDLGVRGGAIYDFLHLCAARKVGASRLYTTDVNDFKSFHRHGDPDIIHP